MSYELVEWVEDGRKKCGVMLEDGLVAGFNWRRLPDDIMPSIIVTAPQEQPMTPEVCPHCQKPLKLTIGQELVDKFIRRDGRSAIQIAATSPISVVKVLLQSDISDVDIANIRAAIASLIDEGIRRAKEHA